MFEQALLDSSLDHMPVITGRHRIISMLAGLAGFLVTWKLLPILFFAVSTRTALVQSLLLGTAVALHALMLCYVRAEARRLKFAPLGWVALTCVSNAVGFIAFLASSARRTGNWKRVTVPLASVCEILLLSALVLIPLIRTQAIGLDELRSQLIILPSIPRARPAGPVREGPRKPTPHVVRSDQIVAPTAVPTEIAIVHDPSPPDSPSGDGVIGIPNFGGESHGGVLIGDLIGPGNSGPPPPIPATPKPKLPRRIKVSVLESARLIHSPRPDYPSLAKMAHIQGTVRLEAVIGTDGRVQDLKVIAGHPLLVNATLQAVAQWRYQPTLLNGEPVEVQTEIDVNFRLGD